MKVENTKELCELFWYLEDKYKLLDKDISGVKAWQIVRFTLFRSLSEKFNLSQQAHSKMSTVDKLKSFISYLKNSIIKNPFFKDCSRVLVCSHARPVRVDGETIDIYTHYLIEELKKENIDYLELESPFLGKHDKSHINNTSFRDFFILLQNIISKFMTVRFTNDEKAYIQEINNSLSKSFKAEVDISKILKNKIIRYKIGYFLYTKLLKRLEVKKVYVVVSYVHADLIAAAKSLDIEVVEIQHGVFSKYHLGYSYPKRTEDLKCFADKFLVWNEYWKDLMKFPISKENILIRKFDFLEINRKKYKNILKQNQLVVLSQGNVGNLIAQLVLNNLELFKNIQIKYKLHPSEFDRYEKYKALRELIKVHTDIEIIKDTNLHKLLAKSKFQIGINSTALYEGVEFNCETILFDISGIEYMERFIEFYNLKKVKSLYLTSNAKELLIR